MTNYIDENSGYLFDNVNELSNSIELSNQDKSFITETTVAQYWHDTFSLATLILIERYNINLHDKLSDLSDRTGI